MYNTVLIRFAFQEGCLIYVASYLDFQSEAIKETLFFFVQLTTNGRKIRLFDVDAEEEDDD